MPTTNGDGATPAANGAGPSREGTSAGRFGGGRGRPSLDLPAGAPGFAGGGQGADARRETARPAGLAAREGAGGAARLAEGAARLGRRDGAGGRRRQHPLRRPQRRRDERLALSGRGRGGRRGPRGPARRHRPGHEAGGPGSVRVGQTRDRRRDPRAASVHGQALPGRAAEAGASEPRRQGQASGRAPGALGGRAPGAGLRHLGRVQRGNGIGARLRRHGSRHHPGGRARGLSGRQRSGLPARRAAGAQSAALVAAALLALRTQSRNPSAAVAGTPTPERRANVRCSSWGYGWYLQVLSQLGISEAPENTIPQGAVLYSARQVAAKLPSKPAGHTDEPLAHWLANPDLHVARSP